MPFEIKPAYESDYLEIIEVWEASVRATHHFLQEENIQFFKPLILNEYLKAVQLWCVRNDNHAIVAFLGVAANNLEMLFIHPSARGIGIGKKLLQFSIQELKVNKVDVNEQNQQAVGFYTRLGFEIIGRSDTDGLGKPFPILHMELSKSK
jgi:putative acetyltransferase